LGVRAGSPEAVISLAKQRMQQNKSTKSWYVLAKAGILRIDVVLGQSERSHELLESICGPLSDQESTHPLANESTANMLDVILPQLETFQKNVNDVPTFRHIEHQLEHHENGGGYGHVINIEFRCIPSRRLYIIPCTCVFAFAILCWQRACWIQFCIFQSLSRGGRGWYDEARIEGVERV
jgi:hypothetical protein